MHPPALQSPLMLKIRTLVLIPAKNTEEWLHEPLLIWRVCCVYNLMEMSQENDKQSHKDK